jgi:hypothetical protein
MDQYLRMGREEPGLTRSRGIYVKTPNLVGDSVLREEDWSAWDV